MSLGKKPTIFVSSTCYDLKQIRSDINAFVSDQLGYDVLLSEFDSFPLDPTLQATDNCLRAVEERADVFVLIVGCRYGSVNETGYSITNLEYTKAKAKGIPIYAFVDKSILSVLPLWRDNPDMNYQSTVDTPKLFEFVDEFRRQDSVWSFGFDSAQEIIHALRTQLGYLFSDCLEFKQKSVPKLLSKKIIELKGEPFRIAVLRPDAWEHKLFAYALLAGLDELSDKRRDFDFGIAFSPNHQLQSITDIIEYVSIKMNQLQKAVDVLSVIIDTVLPAAFGAPGCPGDADYIVYAVNRLLDVYISIIDWSLDFYSIVADDQYVGLVKSFTKMCETTLNDIEDFSKDCVAQIRKIPDHISHGADPIHINLCLKLNPPNTEAVFRELNALQISID